MRNEEVTLWFRVSFTEINLSLKAAQFLSYDTPILSATEGFFFLNFLYHEFAQHFPLAPDFWTLCIMYKLGQVSLLGCSKDALVHVI